MIRKCNDFKCLSAYQDKRYGKGRRVMNPTAGGSNGTVKDGRKCTICGKAYGPSTSK